MTKTHELLAPHPVLGLLTAPLGQDPAYCIHLSLLSSISLPMPTSQPLGKGLMGGQSHLSVLGLNNDP